MDKDMEHLIGTSLASSLGVLAKPLIDAAAREGYAQAFRDIIHYLTEGEDRSYNWQTVEEIEELAAEEGVDLTAGQRQDT